MFGGSVILDPSPTPPITPSPPAPAAPVLSVTPTAARITLKRGGALTNDTFPINGRVVIGRFDPSTGPIDVDMGALPEAVYISRRHAEIWCDSSGQWYVKDLGSMNGTFVCAAGQTQFQRVTGDHPISDGDEIALGNARFEFRIG
ncbi:MAG: FHA domain-containing protein [Fimbriimonadales bacterium]|nr:FHA domain-containing protein [Fimbriimonadales bacterium]